MVTQIFRRGIDRLVSIHLADGYIRIKDPLSDDEVVSKHDVEVMTCLYIFAKESETIGVEFSGEADKCLWLRFSDQAIANEFLRVLEGMWPTRTKSIAGTIADCEESDAIQISFATPPRPPIPSNQKKFPTHMMISPSVPPVNGLVAVELMPQRDTASQQPSPSIEYTAQAQSQCTFIDVYRQECEARRCLEQDLLLQYIQILGERQCTTSRQPTQSVDDHGAAQAHSQWTFRDLYEQECEARRCLEQGLLLQYIQVLGEMLWQSHSEKLQLTSPPSYCTQGLTTVRINRKDLLEGPTPAGMSVLEETERFVREGMQHYMSQRDAQASRAEKLEMERWEKVIRQKDIDLRRELAAKEMQMVHHVKAMEKERNQFEERWKKEVNICSNLSVQLQQNKNECSNLKDLVDRTIAASRKREGDLHTKIQLLQNAAKGSGLQSNPSSPNDQREVESAIVSESKNNGFFGKFFGSSGKT